MQANAIQLHISLDGIKPSIWRRIVLPIDWNLEQLHLVIQAAFNWKACHLYEFRMSGLRFGDKKLLEDGAFFDAPQVFEHRDVTMRDFVGRGASFTYIYDFGDDWQHTVKIEKYLDLDEPPKTADCIAGARATPPEDVGGVPGYVDFLATMADPKSREYQRTKHWCGGHFDPEWFDLDVVAADVGKALKPNVRRALSQPKPKLTS